MPTLRPRGPSAAHAEAVSRRLASLDAELTAVRAGTVRRPAGARSAETSRDVSDSADDDAGWDVAPPAPWEPLPPAWAGPELHTRVRDDTAHEHDPVIGELPRPGRHASYRSSAPTATGPAPAAAGWAALVPETLRGRAGLGPAQLAVVAVVVSIGLAITCWWVLRSEPEPLPPATPVGALVTPTGGVGVPSSTPADAPAPSASSSASTSVDGAEVVVDVAGKVRRPGIAVLPSGSRVADAIEAAGGARPGVDLTSLNLARVLLDGEQVLVGVAGAPEAVPAVPGVPGMPVDPGASATTGAPGALVNINTADLALLDTLPGVGPVTAQAILDWRTENGGFSAVDDLLDVSGIGEVTLAELTPLVTV